MDADTQEVNFDAPVRAQPARPATPYAGLTRSGCADGCSSTGCVISLKPYCAHPTKGGLHHTDKHSPAALKRFDDATAVLQRDAMEANIAKRKSD